MGANTENKSETKLLLHSLKDFSIEPKSISGIELKTNGNTSKTENLLAFSDDYNYLKTGTMLQNIITKSVSNVIKVNMFNFSVIPLKFKGGEVLGKYETIEDKDIHSIGLNENDLMTSDNNLENTFGINLVDKELNYKSLTEKHFESDFISLNGGSVQCGPHLNSEQKNELIALFNKFPDVLIFDDNKVGKIRGYVYKLILDRNANPVRHPPARTSFENMDVVDKWCDKLETKDIIQPSEQ